MITNPWAALLPACKMLADAVQRLLTLHLSVRMCLLNAESLCNPGLFS